MENAMVVRFFIHGVQTFYYVGVKCLVLDYKYFKN